MNYTYTDNAASILEIKMPHEKGFLIGLEGDTGEYTNIVVQDEDAPRIALEILKAAGYAPHAVGAYTVGTNGHLQFIAQELADCIDACNKLEEAERLDQRRDELAREFTAIDRGRSCGYDGLLEWTRAMVDRIIELEQAAK